MRNLPCLKWLCLLSVLLLAVASSITARAQDPVAGVNVQIEPLIGDGHFCLDIHADRTQDGVPVFIYGCHNVENQRWTITSSNDNRHAIVGAAGMCLDVRGTNSQANGTPTQVWQCHFGDNQRLSFSPDGRIREVRSGKCLMAVAPRDGAPLILNDCRNTPQEVFVIRK